MKFIINFFFLTLICILSLHLGAHYYYYSPFYQPITKAIALITPTKGNSANGVVYFTQQDNSILITAHIKGLTPGSHGFHIHEFGNCACDDAICAGGHFNPTNQPHAGPDSLKRHAGDLGNIVANQEGIAEYHFVDTNAKLNGPYSIIGRAVIVHEKADDLTSQPTGDAGARIGCGVIGIAQ